MSRDNATDIAPVTIHDIAAVCSELDLEFDILAAVEDGTEQVIQTGLPDIRISFEVGEGIVNAFAEWSRELPVDAFGDAIAKINELNSSMIAPALSVVIWGEDENAKVAIQATRGMNASAGLTHNQLGMFIISALSSFDSAFEIVAQLFEEEN